ncbi:MAG: metal ABC transporter permease [Thermoleophilaceae bacterium]
MEAVADALLDPWRSGIGQRALAEVVLLGALGGALGFWVLRYGLTYGAESLAHGLLPGLVLAAVVGFPLLLGAAGGILAAVILLTAVAKDERTGPDTATAVVVTGLLGLGGLLAFAPDVPPRLGDLLFGDPLAATGGDVAATAALTLAGAAALVALHRPLTAVAFDGRGAAALGLRAGAVRLALLVLLAATVAIGARGLGNLLVLAVLVAPAIAVRRHARTPAAAMGAGALVAVAAGVAGLYASHHLSIAAGGAVALALCAAAAIGSMPRPFAASG